jgi:hypothetical protein
MAIVFDGLRAATLGLSEISSCGTPFPFAVSAMALMLNKQQLPFFPHVLKKILLAPGYRCREEFPVNEILELIPRIALSQLDIFSTPDNVPTGHLKLAAINS